jgi:hypothetical protein
MKYQNRRTNFGHLAYDVCMYVCMCGLRTRNSYHYINIYRDRWPVFFSLEPKTGPSFPSYWFWMPLTLPHARQHTHTHTHTHTHIYTHKSASERAHAQGQTRLYIFWISALSFLNLISGFWFKNRGRGNVCQRLQKKPHGLAIICHAENLQILTLLTHQGTCPNGKYLNSTSGANLPGRILLSIKTDSPYISS